MQKAVAAVALALSTAACGGPLADAYDIVDDMAADYTEIHGVMQSEAQQYQSLLEGDDQRCPGPYARANQPPPFDNRLYNVPEWASEIRAYNRTRSACVRDVRTMRSIADWFTENQAMLGELLETGIDQIREDLANGDRDRLGRIMERAFSTEDAFVRMARVSAPLERRREPPRPSRIIRQMEENRSRFAEATSAIPSHIERLQELTESLDSRY